MTILTIAPTPFFSNRGTHIRILEEANALARRGHTVHIATYHIGENAGGSILEGGLLHENVHIHRIPALAYWYTKTSAGASWVKPFLDLQLVFLCRRLLGQFRFDAIHAHLHEGILIGWMTRLVHATSQKIPFLGDLHGSLTAEVSTQGFMRGSFALATLTKIETWINGLPTHLIASSHAAATSHATVVLDAGIPINFSAVERAEKRRAFRIAHSIPEKDIVITYTGGFGAEKGISQFIHAAQTILSSTEELLASVSFICAGAPLAALGGQLSDALRDNPRFHIISPLAYAELQSVLLASDIGVDPKSAMSSEASGKTANYAAAGLVIVSTRPLVEAYSHIRSVIIKGADEQSFTEALRNAIHLTTETDSSAQSLSWTWDAVAETIEPLLQTSVT